MHKAAVEATFVRSRHGQCRQSGVAAPDRPALHHRGAEAGVEEVGSALAAADGWRTVHEGLEVKFTRHLETEEIVILCSSDERRSKERAMRDRFSRRIETALERLAVRVARSKRSGACEPARSDTGEPADRPHPAAKSACRCPLHRGAGAGCLPGRVPPPRRLQRLVR